jgi:hypothetical protein
VKGGGEELRHRQQQACTQWLQSNNVYCVSDLTVTETTKEGVVVGWGYVAKSDIAEGRVLFIIPMGACLRLRAAAPVDDNDGDDNDDDGSTEGEGGDLTAVDS